MNVGKASTGLGVEYAKNNSGDKIQELEQRKNQLTQELKRVKEAAKGGKAAGGEVEKKVKELADQIKNIDEQIATLKNQKQSSDEKTEKISKTEEANKTDPSNSSDEATAKLPKNMRFDEYIKSDESEADKPDITYRVENEDGKHVVKFNKGNAKNEKTQESLSDV